MVRIAGVVAQALVFVYLANRLSVHDMGMFAGVYVYWSLARMLGPFGFDQLSLREIAANNARGMKDAAQALSNFAIICVVVANAALFLFAAGLLCLLSFYNIFVLSPWGILAAAGGAPAYAIAGLLAGQLRGYERIISSQAIESIGLQLPMLAALGILDLGHGVNLGSALSAQAIVAWTVAAGYGLARIRCGIEISAQLTFSSRREFSVHAWQIWQALTITALANQMPTYVCLVLLGAAPTGILDIATRFGTLPAIFITGVSTTFSPLLAGRYATQNMKGMGEALAVSSWLAFIPATGVLVILAFVGPWLLAHLFPVAYQQSYGPALIICSATAIAAGFSMASNAYLMSGGQNLVRLYSGLYLAVVVIGGVLLGLPFGVMGIAAAVLLGTTIRDVGLSLRLGRELDMKPGILNLYAVDAAARAIRGRVQRFRSPNRIPK
jgi:O-antigen/teichoic acid export membrane protein